MKRIGLLVLFVCSLAASAQAQAFTFECFCGYLTAADSNCDVCTSGQQSRYFKGLLIRKDGVAFKWIEQPYTILQNFDALTFRELIPNAEQIRITLAGTPFSTIEQFRDSVMCPCSGGAGILTLIAGPGINIYNDTIASIPQQIDTFDLVSGAQDTIRLSLTRDSVPFHFVILPPDSDNQYIDTLRLTGTTLEISLFGDNLPLSTVDLSSLVADGSETIVTGTNGITVTGTGTSGTPYVVGMPAATNTQTLRHNGTAWVANSLLTNDGSNIGVNSAPSSAALIRIKHASTTDGIIIERSTDTRQLKLYHNGAGTIENTAGNFDIRASNGGLNLLGNGGGGFISQIVMGTQSNITSVFGNSSLLRFNATYSPTTAGGNFGFMQFQPTINQTGSADQDIYFMDFNPTLTSVTGNIHGVNYRPSVGRFLWQPNGAGVVTNHLAGNTGIGSGSTSPAQTLHVQGTARITGSDGTPTSVVGRDGDGDISALGLSGLSIVSGTLTVDAALSLNGIYGDGTAGTGDDILPPGGSVVEIPGQWQPLQFDLNTAASQTWTALRVTTPYSSDDAFSKYFVGVSPVDSIEIYNFDGGGVVKNSGGNLNLESTDLVNVIADSITMSLLPTRTALPFIIGQGAQNVIHKLAGTANGQIPKWNTASGGYWELGTDNTGSGVGGTGAANRLAYWTDASTIAADDDAYFDGSLTGFGTTTALARVNVNGVAGFAPYVINGYGTGSFVYSQLSNLTTTGVTTFSLNEVTDINTIKGGLRRFGSTHVSRANEIEVLNSQSASVTVATNNLTRLTVANTGVVHAHSNLAAGFTSTTGIHSTLQSAGSFATAYLETVGAPTFNSTLRTVVYTASTNISWTLQTPGSCNCPGRELILHHAGSAGTVTLSQTITKGNTGNFNTLTAGQWAYLIYTAGGIRGYKLTSL